MFVLTDKNDVIMHISETLNYQENGNILINNGTLAIPPILVNGVFDVLEIPENVQAQKYCYTETKGFYENENYIERLPDMSNQEIQESIINIELALAEVTEMILGGLE